MIEHKSPPAVYVEINAQRFPLEVGQIYLFGKHLTTTTNHEGDTIAFNIENEDVAEKHCCVEVSVDEDVYVFDLFSSRGTFINGERLKPLEKACVKTGDIMKLGPLQSVRFYHEQLEVSHNSSGFGDNQRNTSDIIASSPESTSQRETRVKRFNSHSNDNFLVPAVPPPTKQSASRASISFVVPETEEALSASRRSSLGLNSSQNKSRKSDSFTIPETQYCGGRASLASNLSIAESTVDDDKTKSGISFDVSADGAGDDDFCIPETQDISMMNSERPQRPLRDNPPMNGLKTLEEKSVDLNDSDDESNALAGSQLRICTQDYNDGFGEEEDLAMQSQVIPLIKHNTVLLDRSLKPQTTSKTPQQEVSEVKQTTPQDEADREIAKINWSSSKPEDDLNDLNCTTPDLFECQALDAVARKETAAKDSGIKGVNLFENDPTALDDEEDYLPTQIFPASNNNKLNDKEKLPKEKNIFSGKEDEPFLTLSDKENMHPGRIEPITELPPTQLFATIETPSERSLASTSSRKSNSSKTEEKQKEVSIAPVVPTTTTTNNVSNVLETSTLAVVGDEEDDILTQAFVPPPAKTTLSANGKKSSTHNYFNSTLLDDRAVGRNPASFFAEMETTPKKVQNTPELRNAFKLPEKLFSAVRKTSSAASTASTDSDMDLLMCTPQLLRDQMPVSKADDLKKHILAIKNKKLFGDDVDESDDLEDDDRRSKDNNCLVQLINVPKDSKDFDKLLPHLKHDNQLNKKHTKTEEQHTAKEAHKAYKFNISFGKEQKTNEKKANNSGKSSTVSRDERHAARDKEKEVTDTQGKRKSHKDEKQRSSRRNKHDDAQTSRDKDIGDEEKGKHKEHNRSHSDENQKRDSSGKSKHEKAHISKSSKNRKNESNEGNESFMQSEVAQQNTNDKSKSSTLPQKEENESNGKKHTTRGRPKETPDTSKKDNAKDDKNVREVPTKRSTRAIQEKDTNKKTERNAKTTTSTTNGGDISEEITIVKQASQRKTKEKDQQEETQRFARRRTRQQSSDKPAMEEVDAFKPLRRTTRLKSIASKDSAATLDDLDSIPTQPLIRNTRARTRSRSVQKDASESVEIPSNTSSSKVSHSSSTTSRTLNRSHSRPNISHTDFITENAGAPKRTSVSSNATTIERKRKSDVPVPPQNNERKRMKRTLSQESTISTTTSTSSVSSRPLISITMVDPERFNELNVNSKGLWAVAKDPKESEILVMDKSFRTFKFLLAMARGIPIVTSQWLKDINAAKSAKKIPPLGKYLLSDPLFEKKHKFTLEASLQQARENKKGIFHGYEFVMTTNIKPSPAEIQAIIEISGGIVHAKGPPPAKDNQKIYLISSQDDRKDWHKFRRSNSNIIIVATEAIMSAIMRQNCTPLSNHILA